MLCHPGGEDYILGGGSKTSPKTMFVWLKGT